MLAHWLRGRRAGETPTVALHRLRVEQVWNVQYPELLARAARYLTRASAELWRLVMTEKDELYYSNRGKGPGIARVVSINDGVVTLEYKNSSKARQWIMTTISKKFFKSNRCGWKMAKTTN